MRNNTQPVFIVGTGRCGTRALYKMLLGVPGVEAHHEYLCTHVQQIACLYSMGRMSRWEACQKLYAIYGAAVELTDADVWVDSSNKASWVIDILRTILPKSKFVCLYRDGRKVVSSFYHKLAAECYDDKSVEALTAWYEGEGPMPPPEKKYWWRVLHGDRLDQFTRMCWHWRDCNAEIRRQTKGLPGCAISTKIEELAASPDRVDALADFIGIPRSSSYFEQLQRPEGVFFPMDFTLTPEQEERFNRICGPMMKELGYDGDVYRVNY